MEVVNVGRTYTVVLDVPLADYESRQRFETAGCSWMSALLTAILLTRALATLGLDENIRMVIVEEPRHGKAEQGLV